MFDLGFKKNVMRLIVFFMLILMGLPAFAQGEFINNNTAIPAARNPNASSISKPSTPSIYTPNVYNTPPKTTSSSTIIGDKPVDFSKTNEFANPNDRYIEKLNKKETGENYVVFRKNQYLGDFKTKSKKATIMYRDFGEVDGDQIKVLVNDRVVVSQIFLDSNYKILELELAPGFNKIDFEALNQGMYGPNTAQFQVLDDKGQTISANQWNLATGFKATIILFKE